MLNKIKKMLSIDGKDKAKGFVLITSYLLLSVLSTYSLANFSRYSSYMQATERNINKIVAFNMAEAGFDYALAQLTTNPDYEGTDGSYSFVSSTEQGSYYVQGGSFNINVTSASDESDSDENEAEDSSEDDDDDDHGCNRSSNNRHSDDDDDDDEGEDDDEEDSDENDSDASGVLKITVTGGSYLENHAYEARSIEGYVEPVTTGGGDGLFNFAIFATNSIMMSGNAGTDSYNSANGAYSSSSAGSNGDIGTSQTRAGYVMMSGNTTVKGDAEVGYGVTNVSSMFQISGNSTITGTKSSATSVREYETQDTSTTSSGALSVSGNSTLSLAAGTYNYTSLKISGNAKIVPLGAVTIYVSGTVSIAGNGVATVNNKPSNLLIYSTGTSSVTLSGNGNFYGGIYSPNSTVKVTGNGSVYGAVVAKDYQQSGNGKVHYDEDLANIGASDAEGSGYNVLSWREKSTTANNSQSA